MRCESKSHCVKWRRWTLIAAVLLACPPPLCTQKVSDQEVKAAYLYNFAKFVEWPAGAFSSSTAPLRLCLLSGDPLGTDLIKVVRGKSIATHPVTVVAVRREEEYRACHVLFMGSLANRNSRQILEGLHGTSVLTVGDAEQFTKDGGMIRFVLDKDRVQFEVNHKAAEEAQLNVSSRLLRVARAVIE